MKINFSQKLKNLEGKELKEDGKEVTLGAVCVNSLIGILKDETPSGEEKLLQYNLAVRINQENDVDLTVEEIALIKKLAGKMFTPLVVGQTYHMLEGK